LVSFFKDRSAAAAIWVLLLSLAVHFHFFINPPQVLAGEADGLISLVLAKYLVGEHEVVIILLYHFLVVTQALRLNYLFNDHRMFAKPSFLTAMAYVLLTAVLKEWNHLTPALVANSLVIWLYAKTVRLYNNPNPKTLLFNIGLVIGLAVLLYHPTTLLVIVALFALLVVRPFSLPEILVMFMGIATPFYFLGAYLFLTDQFHTFLKFLPLLEFNLPRIEVPIMFFISLAVIISVLIIGIVNWQDKNRRMVIQIRKNWGVLVVMLWVMLPLPFINDSANWETLLLWCIPASPFVSYAFSETKKDTFPNIIFWTFIVLAVINNWNIINLLKN
jgi:hypothetical protein